MGCMSVFFDSLAGFWVMVQLHKSLYSGLKQCGRVLEHLQSHPVRFSGHRGYCHCAIGNEILGFGCALRLQSPFYFLVL